MFERTELSAAQCLERLNSATLGRIVISIRCLPAARPVHIAVVGDTLYLASDEAAVIEAAGQREVLTLQIDGADSPGQTWMVEATGMAWVVDPRSGTNPIPESSHLFPVLDSGGSLVGLPLTLVRGDMTRWSFPRPPH